MEENQITKIQLPVETTEDFQAESPPEKIHSQAPLHDHEWWFVEIWKEKREVFKALVEHVFAFTLLIGTLILFHYVFKYLDLPPERKEILETIDFWGIALALLIFGLTFLYKLVDDAVQTAKKKAQAERIIKLQMERVLINEIGLEGESLHKYITQELVRMGNLVK